MLVEIENLKIAFQTRTSRFEAVRGVSMKLGTEKLGIVGESGSGKSLTARALMKLLPSMPISAPTSSPSMASTCCPPAKGRCARSAASGPASSCRTRNIR